jgi:NADPH:quinone reductase-like Zn-dependent oxidoreductase
VVEELKRRGREDGMFDLLIDNVDSPAIFWGSEAWLKEGGRYVTIAGAVSLGFFKKIGTMMYLPKMLGGVEREARFLRRRSDRQGFEKIAAWMAEGKLKPVIAREFALEDAKDAFVELKKGRVRGKLVVKVEN